jgi:hypothetical protein
MFQVPKLECLIAKYRSCLKRLILWIKKNGLWYLLLVWAPTYYSHYLEQTFIIWYFRLEAFVQTSFYFLKSCSKKEILLYQCKSITANQYPRLYMSSSDRVFQWSLTCFVARINKWLEKNLWSSIIFNSRAWIDRSNVVTCANTLKNFNPDKKRLTGD